MVHSSQQEMVYGFTCRGLCIKQVLALKIPVSAQKKRSIPITTVMGFPEKNGNLHISSQIFICMCDNTSLQ